MNRLTHERSNGIKSGYWSPNKKEELVQRLAAYENTGLEPDEIEEYRWISAEERLPQKEGLYLVTQRYGTVELNYYGGGHFTGAFGSVIAWMPLPEAYRPETGSGVNRR